MYLELDEDDLTEEVRALLPPPSSTARRSTQSFTATNVNGMSFPSRSSGSVGGKRVVGSSTCSNTDVAHHRHATPTYQQYPYPMVESISMAYYSDEEGEGSPKSQSPPPPAVTPPRSSSPPLTEYSPPDACVVLPPPPPTTTRTHAADRLNTISNRFCAAAVASEGVGEGRLGCTALISSLAVAPARHAVLTYADLRKELYSRMEYNNDTRNDIGMKEEEVRLSPPPVPGTQSSCSSPSPHRGGGSPPYPWRPILDGGGGVHQSSMLLRYQPPPSNRHPNNRRSEVPIKAPSSSSTAGIYRSASEASPSFQVVDEGARPTHRSPSLPNHTVFGDTCTNKAKATPNSVRLLGGDDGGRSRCQGTKAGPTAETAAARTLFAMLVAEDERTGAVLRSEASAAAALSSLL